jgi:methionyl-tRNA synthetase
MLNNFLSKPLPDLCVSRTSYTWGIPVEFEPNHVIYVWIDALMNYITGIGYKNKEESGELYNKYWPANVHLIGKDILRFHTIYWPIMLMALNLPLPKQVFGHPWILMNHGKMSKSKGNVIYTEDLVEYFGVDAVRYYVLHEIPFAADGNITYELVCEKTNSDLANTLGNLVNRTIAMVKKYFGDAPIVSKVPTEFDENLKNVAANQIKEYKSLMDQFKVADGIEAVIKLLRQSNKYIDETAPWVLAKDEANKDKLMTVLYNLLECIRLSAVMLEPIMPTTSAKIYTGLQTALTNFADLEFAKHEAYNVNTIEVLFKRLDVKEIMDSVVAKETKKEEPKKVEAPKKEVVAKHQIEFPDFEKLDLGVGQIVEAAKHPKADKLLVFKVDCGNGDVRQIVSGIAKFYKPEELVGKKVVVVKNLKPIKLRGVESHGMLLCASNSEDTKLELLNVSNLEAGDLVS